MIEVKVKEDDAGECKTVVERIYEIGTDFCDNYCKFTHMSKINMSDEEFDSFLKDICANCPINRLF